MRRLISITLLGFLMTLGAVAARAAESPLDAATQALYDNPECIDPESVDPVVALHLIYMDKFRGEERLDGGGTYRMGELATCIRKSGRTGALSEVAREWFPYFWGLAAMPQKAYRVRDWIVCTSWAVGDKAVEDIIREYVVEAPSLPRYSYVGPVLEVKKPWVVELFMANAYKFEDHEVAQNPLAILGPLSSAMPKVQLEDLSWECRHAAFEESFLRGQSSGEQKINDEARILALLLAVYFAPTDPDRDDATALLRTLVKAQDAHFFWGLWGRLDGMINQLHEDRLSPATARLRAVYESLAEESIRAQMAELKIPAGS